LRGRYEMLRLNLSTFICNPGRHFPFDFRSVGEQATGLFEDLSFRTALEVSGDAFCQLNTLYFKVQIRTTVEQACRRCLAPVYTTVDCYEAFTLPFRTEDHEVDLAPYVLGGITAVLNPRPLCRNDCRGLCPRCATDLNEPPDHACPVEEEDEHQRLGDFLR